MSAFIVGHDHIDALLTFALDSRRNGPVSYVTNNICVRITKENVTEIGRHLLTENERSVRYRYPDYGPLCAENAENYKFRPWTQPLTALSILKACDCFDYQACETGDYWQSLAYTIIDAIRARAIRRLPGYTDAPGWEFRRRNAKLKTAARA